MTDPEKVDAARQPLAAGNPRHPRRRGGIGWLLTMAVFACMGLLPFAIAAIVLFGR